MRGTEKQIAYATDLKAQFIEPRMAEIERQNKFIAEYRARMEADSSRDYSDKIIMRQNKIEKAARQIEAINSIEDAGELISAIKGGRPSLFW